MTEEEGNKTREQKLKEVVQEVDPSTNKRGKFVYRPNGGGEVLAEYLLLDQKGVEKTVMDIYHTYTPSSLRGQGLASIVTERALDYAVEQGYLVKASCSYVAHLLAAKEPYASKYKAILL